MDSLYIGGVDRTNYLKHGTPDMEFQLNTRSMFDLEFLDTSGAVRPVLNDEVIYTIDERTLTVDAGSGSPVVTIASGLFTASDQGKAIVITGAGPAAGLFTGKILTYLSGTQVEVEFDIDTTVSGATARVGYRRFCGFIQDMDEEPFYADSGIKVRISCADFNAGAEMVLFNGIGTGPTLRDHVDESLTSGLTSRWGIVRDPNMATGPSIGPIGVPFKFVMEYWKELSRISGWVFVVDQFKIIRFYEVGTIPAPLTIDSSIPLAGTLKINYTYNQYRNDQWVWFGGSSQFDYTETVEGDGSTDRWTLSGAPVGGFPSRGYVSVTISGALANYPLGIEGSSGLEWTYNPLTNQLVNAVGPLAIGDTWSLIYVNQGPLVAHREDLAQQAIHSLRGHITQVDSILTMEDAEAYADDLLRRYARTPRILTFSTYNAQLEVGQTVEVDLPNRGIVTTDFLIDSITARDDESGNEDEHLIYEIHAIEGEEFQNLWIEFFRDAGGGSLGTGPGSPGIPATGTIPPPFPVVEFRAKSFNAADTTSHPITMPGGIQPGELLLVVVAMDQIPTITINTAVSGNDWTIEDSTVQSTNVTGTVIWKVATGPSDVLELTTSSAQQNAHISMRISGVSLTSPFVSVSSFTSNGSNPDPASLTPSTGQLSYLWIVTRCGDSNASWAGGAPTGYSNLYQQIGSISGGTVATAERQLNASTENPGVWTAGLAFSVVHTIALRPV